MSNRFSPINRAYQVINVFLVAMSILAIGYALIVLQSMLALNPCPLCIFQRIGVMGMGLFALLSLILNPISFAGRFVLWMGAVVSLLWGIAVAGRHVWLLHLPADQVPACGPGLDYLLEVLPLFGVLREVFTGSGECAALDWTLFGLSIPNQALIFFLCLLGVLIWQGLLIANDRAPKHEPRFEPRR